MITIAAVCRKIPGLTETQLRAWVDQDLIRPALRQGEPSFEEIDLARVRLIIDLHQELEVEEPTVPLILALLDQLYATRCQLRQVLAAADENLLERLERLQDE